MITDSHQSWVLHKRPSGDTSAQVTFFTREKGVVSALCKGGRTPKKQALLQAFTPLLISFDVRRDWCYVREMDVISPSLVLEGDLLLAGLYVNEILYHGLRQMDSIHLLYDAYVQTLYELTQVKQRLNIEAVLRRFEWQFLSSCGYEFSLTHDAHTLLPIISTNHYHFIAGEGFSLASKGIPGDCIIAMANDNLAEPLVLKAAKWIMRRAIDNALDGKRIKAREFYQFNQINPKVC